MNLLLCSRFFIAFIIAIRYTLFFPSSLLPAPCSLLPKTQRFVPHGYNTCYIYYSLL
ncbi:MAG: hypothetical protein F6K26_37360 [Moorea sp. SIO2I5]|nr:hypothetical protein [Moorena sp. SIO2I5]